MQICIYETCVQTAASQRATSRAFRGRSIGRADGPDRSIRGHFTKNPFYVSEINPRSRGPLIIFCKKHLRLFPNQPAVQNGWAPGWLVRRANGDAGASHQRGGAAHAGEPSAATTAHQPPARRRSTRGQAEHGHHRAPQDRAPPTDEAAERPEHTWISAARPSSTSSTDALVRG